jgi:hypothetical protein
VLLHVAAAPALQLAGGPLNCTSQIAVALRSIKVLCFLNGCRSPPRQRFSSRVDDLRVTRSTETLFKEAVKELARGWK